MNILIIEDDPTDLKLFTAVLNSHNHEVVGMETPELMWEAIEARRPDAILLDLMLPGIDGLEVARRLKADSTTMDIPIIATSAAAEKYTRKAASDAGCDLYIFKPVDTRELNAVMIMADSMNRPKQAS